MGRTYRWARSVPGDGIASRVDPGGGLSTGKRILVPLLYDYYLFDYFQKLIPRLIADGFEVTLLTLDDKIQKSYGSIEGLRMQRGPRSIGRLHHARVPVRVALWAVGWVWTLWVSRRHDFVIVPWANKPIWYMFLRRLPSMACETTTVFMDIDNEIEYMTLSAERGTGRSYRISERLDRVLGGRYLPKVRGTTMVYRPGFHFVAKLMGYRPPNYFSAFAGLDYFAVPGARYAENYLSLGITGTVFPVVGSPAYEDVFSIAERFVDEGPLFKRDLGLPPDGTVCTFFLSPSSFSEEQLEEVATVVEAARSWRSGCTIVLKFHPKTDKGDPPRFRERLSALGSDLVLLTDFGGDDFNTRLILSSDVVVQKQGTVGFIAMLLKRPMISYDLTATGYLDDMYKRLQASFHAETQDELRNAFEKLDNPVDVARLKELQSVACQRYCLDAPSPCGLISQVIKGHFER